MTSAIKLLLGIVGFAAFLILTITLASWSVEPISHHVGCFGSYTFMDALVLATIGAHPRELAIGAGFVLACTLLAASFITWRYYRAQKLHTSDVRSVIQYPEDDESNSRKIRNVLTSGIGLLGSTTGGVLALSGLWYLARAGFLSDVGAIAAAAAIGIAGGFLFAFKSIDYCVTYHPDAIMKTYDKWKRDGRWDRMLAAMHERRSSVGQ